MSVLAGLLHRYILANEPNTKVIFCEEWKEMKPLPTIPGAILILDEAQTTYWDKVFWNRFKNPDLYIMQVIAFANHGTTGYSGIDRYQRMWVGRDEIVGLSYHLERSDGIVLASFSLEKNSMPSYN